MSGRGAGCCHDKTPPPALRTRGLLLAHQGQAVAHALAADARVAEALEGEVVWRRGGEEGARWGARPLTATYIRGSGRQRRQRSALAGLHGAERRRAPGPRAGAELICTVPVSMASLISMALLMSLVNTQPCTCYCFLDERNGWMWAGQQRPAPAPRTDSRAGPEVASSSPRRPKSRGGLSRRAACHPRPPAAPGGWR